MQVSDLAMDVKFIHMGNAYPSYDTDEIVRLRLGFRKLLGRLDESVVALDFGATQSFGAAFMGALAEFSARLGEVGKELVVFGLKPELLRMLEVAGLTDRTEVFRNRAEVTRSLRLLSTGSNICRQRRRNKLACA